MNHSLFTGVCTALVTPFLDGRVNYPMTERLLHRQVEAGVPAVVIAGTTGESSTLSDQEKLMLFRRSKEYVKDDCIIIAGAGSNSTEHCIELSKAATDTGVDALLIVAPYYNKCTKSGLISHYARIAESVNLPVIIYNVPSRTGIDIPEDVYLELSKIQNIVGVKESSSDITKIARIRNRCGCDFAIWSGNDDQVIPVMSLGGQGVISVVSNICPEETVAMVSAALAGDYKLAAALQCGLYPLIELLFCEVNPVPVKEAMKMIGFDCGDCRLPLGNLSKESQDRLSRYFR